MRGWVATGVRGRAGGSQPRDPYPSMTDPCRAGVGDLRIVPSASSTHALSGNGLFVSASDGTRYQPRLL
jgi:hypothetical protein